MVCSLNLIMVVAASSLLEQRDDVWRCRPGEEVDGPMPTLRQYLISRP